MPQEAFAKSLKFGLWVFLLACPEMSGGMARETSGLLEAGDIFHRRQMSTLSICHVYMLQEFCSAKLALTMSPSSSAWEDTQCFGQDDVTCLTCAKVITKLNSGLGPPGGHGEAG